MAYTVQQQLEAQIVPVEQMNLLIVNHYVEDYRAGKKLSPSKERLARAALELHNAYAAKDHWEVNETHPWPKTDEEMFVDAIVAFKDGTGRPMHWGVRQEHIPRNAVEGDTVVVHSFFMGERIVYEGIVKKVIDYPTATGWVIEVREAVDHYLFDGIPRSKYMSLWAAHDTRIMAGFML